MQEWKRSVDYFLGEVIVPSIYFDYEYLKLMSESKFGSDTDHAKGILDFVNICDDNKEEYEDYVVAMLKHNGQIS